MGDPQQIGERRLRQSLSRPSQPWKGVGTRSSIVDSPDSVVDGDVIHLILDDGEALTVISTESLVLDQIGQATDRTDVTFNEAVPLCRALRETADWSLIESKLEEEDRQVPLLRLRETYERILAKTE